MEPFNALPQHVALRMKIRLRPTNFNGEFYTKNNDFGSYKHE
jgi:hypothetical protein